MMEPNNFILTNNYDYNYNYWINPFSIILWIMTIVFFWRMSKMLKVILRILTRNERQIYKVLENLNERLKRR